jgi:hypothetical protein
VAEEPPTPYVPPPPPRATLDPAALARIRAETRLSEGLVEAALRDEPPPEPVTTAAPAVAPGGGHAPGRRPALDEAHARLLRVVGGRPSWTAEEFGEAARRVGLMPGGAVESLNDWALDRHGDVLLEGDDPIAVNQDLVAGDVEELV